MQLKAPEKVARIWPGRGMLGAMPRPAAARQQLTHLRTQLGRIERLRVRLIDNQPVTMSDLLLLVDRVRDGINVEIRQAKTRWRSVRPCWPTARGRPRTA